MKKYDVTYKCIYAAMSYVRKNNMSTDQIMDGFFFFFINALHDYPPFSEFLFESPGPRLPRRSSIRLQIFFWSTNFPGFHYGVSPSFSLSSFFNRLFCSFVIGHIRNSSHTSRPFLISIKFQRAILISVF